MCLDHAREEGAHRIGVGDVSDDGCRGRPAVGDLLQRALAATTQDHRVTALEQACRHGLPDPRAGAGHHCHLCAKRP